MSISIERRMRPSVDGLWECTGGYSSIDAAKAACRYYRKDYWSGNPRNVDFRIYQDDKLVLVSAIGSGHRLRWVPGNGKSRAEQASSSLIKPEDRRL